MPKKTITVDGNYAAAHVAYALSEVSAIYPITPSSTMGEWIDEWASQGKKNIWGKEVKVAEMQSEAGAAGAVHGSLAAGSLTSTYTASQGLLLMIPVMHKAAGEMLPHVIHVSARALAAQSLAIFGDHTDVMGCRNTGYAMLAANSVQEEMDLALVAHLATYKAKVPFLQFFDGFRTSHEVHKIEEISYEDIAKLVEPKYIEEFRQRALRPEAPVCKVGAQNTDVYFQGRETVNKYYEAVPDIVQEYMDKVAAVTGRQYHPFDYVGAPDATDVIVAIGSGCETIEETINYLNAKRGTKYGLVKVRLYRPFDVKRFNEALPSSTKRIVVLDRTKEPGSIGEPLYLDVVAALENKDIRVIGGRYGLSSKEFTPSMVLAIYKHSENNGFHGFTVGITDDVTNKSLKIEEHIVTEPEGTTNCMFWGLGSDGTVGANKNSIKIIGQYTDKDAQAYFAYDSKKSFGVTVSHLRFGDQHIKSTYLITAPDFVSCSAHAYIGRYDLLRGIKEGGTFLLNSPYSKEEAFAHLTRDMQETIINKKIKFYNVDAESLIKQQPGLRGKGANTVMMVAYFKVSGIIPFEQALEGMREMTKKTFKKKGDDVVNMNLALIDAAVDACEEVPVPSSLDGVACAPEVKLISDDADDFAKKIIEPSMRQKGDDIPVSAMSVDGVIPTGTACLEKRGIAPRVPHWNSENCIQCGICASACPHAAIRTKLAEKDSLKDAPASFKTIDAKPNANGEQFKVQVYCEDCTGCGVCIDQCPANKNPEKQALTWSTIEDEVEIGELVNEKYFDELPDNVMGKNTTKTIKGAMLRKPLFEFSGACAGCGETPYVKLVSQLFGENAIVANATGCSSIYSGTFPTIPYTKTKEGRGPAWSNSLFEDAAEFGLGFKLSQETQLVEASDLMEKLKDVLGADLVKAIMDNYGNNTDAGVKTQIANLKKAKEILAKNNSFEAKHLASIIDVMLERSVWIVGGDGWAYDIGFGGLDHVLASGKKIRVLVMDTEVYSNTGGQASKATNLGASAKFAVNGKNTFKKDLGAIMMSYGNVYVAQVAIRANPNQALKAFKEAEAYDGPALIIGYSSCIAHGVALEKSFTQQKNCVDSGMWMLYRYNPSLIAEGKNPLQIDSKEPKLDLLETYLYGETRYSNIKKANPEHAKEIVEMLKDHITRRWKKYKLLADNNL